MANVLRTTPGARRDDKRAAHVEMFAGPGNPPVQIPTASGDDDTSTRSAPDREMTIRLAGMRDIVRMRSMDMTYRLNQPESMLANRNPLARAAGVITTRGERKPTTLLAESNGELLGYSEFRPSMPDLRWNLCTLGLQSISDDPLPVWLPLLEEGTRLAGAAGVKRLFARAPVDSPVGEALRRAGYSTYARERIHIATTFCGLSTGVTFREQERTDTWAVHQLYNHSVPKEVVNAEAYTSHRWELSEYRTESAGSVRAWIHEESDGPIVYVRSESARRRHVLDAIFAFGRVATAASVIDSLAASGALQLEQSETYLAVRSYNLELEQFLDERGFRPWLDQDLFIRYTTAPLRVQSAEAVLLEAEAHERNPKQVPAYYTGLGDPGERSLHVVGKRTAPAVIHRQSASAAVE